MSAGPVVKRTAIALASATVLLTAGSAPVLSATPSPRHPSGSRARETAHLVRPNQPAIGAPSSCAYVRKHLAHYAAQGVHEVMCVIVHKGPVVAGP